MKQNTTIIATALCLAIATPAHAQRYDSSYDYEMRGFVPPSPFPRAWRERDKSVPFGEPISAAEQAQRAQDQRQRERVLAPRR
jgi:hypothetical protein